MRKEDILKVGEFIQEEMRERGWDKDELAVRMNTKAIQHSMVELDFIFALDDERNAFLGQKTCDQLGEAFGIDPQFFMNIDANHRKCLKAIAENEKVVE